LISQAIVPWKAYARLRYPLRSVHKALAKLEPEPGQRMLEEVRQAVRQFEGPQGIQAPAELLLGVGVKYTHHKQLIRSNFAR
jgi:hypothetical protein